jgi:hypothetical protein
MTMSATSVRVALIGYGFVGEKFHVPLITSTRKLRLAVVASRQKERVLSALPDVEVTDAQTALAHRDIELVVIASPNDSHFSLARVALQAGKHVIVDKPFTTTLVEALDAPVPRKSATSPNRRIIESTEIPFLTVSGRRSNAKLWTSSDAIISFITVSMENYAYS